MQHTNDNIAGVQEAKPLLLQLLIPACRTVRQRQADYAWLHGYALLTCRIEKDTARLWGDVRIGLRYEENGDLLASLAEALNPAAVLVGLDLTSVVSALGRLPIDTDNPAPALAVLSKLHHMLQTPEPIDMGIAPETVMLVEAERLAMSLAGGGHGAPRMDGPHSAEDIDSGNPSLLADKLADEAGACLLAMGQLILTQAERVQLDTAWRNWRRHQVPSLPRTEVPAETDA